jgi:hypothetical protein
MVHGSMHRADSSTGSTIMPITVIPTPSKSEALGQLQCRIEGLIQALCHPVLVENEVVLMDFAAAQWRLTVEFGKLLLTAWNAGKSISRRVEAVAYQDGNRFGIFVHSRGKPETSTLEFRAWNCPAVITRAAGRASHHQQFLAFLKGEYREWKFERVSNRSDREHSFSAWYTRGMARMGREAWAFLGLGEDEGSAAADGALGFGLIWVDWLRSRSERVAITQLKLFLPLAAVPIVAHRAAYLNTKALALEIYAWRPGQPSATPIDLCDYGNIETRLAPRRQAELLKESHSKLLAEILNEDSKGVEVTADTSGTKSSLRVAGLEVGMIEGDLAPRLFFGLEGSVEKLNDSNRDDFRHFIREVLRVRRAHSPEPHHDYYRLQSERWLESILFRDIARIDPALSPEHVYRQVPAFAARDRGVIDLLTVTRQGRLAVVELKVHEEINLPLQGLDYWLRVNWLQSRDQFGEAGYFPGCELTPESPLLYLVSPAFRFHSTTGKLLKYFDPRIETILIGINDTWRDEIRILFRHSLSPSRA